MQEKQLKITFILTIYLKVWIQKNALEVEDVFSSGCFCTSHKLLDLSLQDDINLDSKT